MDPIVHSQQMDSILNETTETDFKPTLKYDGTLLLSHTVNTLSLIDLGTKSKQNNKNKVINDTTKNSNNFSKAQKRTTCEINPIDTKFGSAKHNHSATIYYK